VGADNEVTAVRLLFQRKCEVQDPSVMDELRKRESGGGLPNNWTDFCSVVVHTVVQLSFVDGQPGELETICKMIMLDLRFPNPPLRVDTLVLSERLIAFVSDEFAAIWDVCADTLGITSLGSEEREAAYDGALVNNRLVLVPEDVGWQLAPDHFPMPNLRPWSAPVFLFPQATGNYLTYRDSGSRRHTYERPWGPAITDPSGAFHLRSLGCGNDLDLEDYRCQLGGASQATMRRVAHTRLPGLLASGTGPQTEHRRALNRRSQLSAYSWAKARGTAVFGTVDDPFDDEAGEDTESPMFVVARMDRQGFAWDICPVSGIMVTCHEEPNRPSKTVPRNGVFTVYEVAGV